MNLEEYKLQHKAWLKDDIQIRKEMSRSGGDKAVWWPHFCGIIPRRVNGRWYWREWIWYTERFGPGGVRRQYGDDFDKLRDDR